MADDNDVSVLELRGILQLGSFELLRIHERSLDVAERHVRGTTPLEYATARLTAQDGRAVSDGWVGAAATTFDDAGTQPFGARSQLVRVLLPLPREEGRGAALWAELLVGDEVVWREPVEPQRPRLVVSADLVEEALRVRWDTDAAAPVDVLLRSHDGGSRLRVAESAEGGVVELPLDSLPGGPTTVLVRLSSGLRESVAESDPLELPPRKGTLHLRLERPQAPLGQPVTAFATVVDSWGVPRSADGVRWTSDDEVVGTGQMVALQLSVGTHVLRAETDDVEPADAELTVTDGPSDQAPPTDA